MEKFSDEYKFYIDDVGNIFTDDNETNSIVAVNDELDIPSDIMICSKIIKLRLDKYTYSGIQLKLGNPSKKFIRSVLLKYSPKLISIDCNYNKL